MVLARALLQIWPLPQTTLRIAGAIRAGMEKTILQLLSPCFFSHGHLIRTRDEAGYLALQCIECGRSKRVLAQQPIKGPRFHAAPVKGAPLAKVKRVDAQPRRFPRSA